MEQSLHIKQLHLVQPLTLVLDALHISYSYSLVHILIHQQINKVYKGCAVIERDSKQRLPYMY